MTSTAENSVDDRAWYAAQLAGGTARFFGPRRHDCPWCGSTRLTVEVRSKELYQRKPGRFTLEKCKTCNFVFQNPRLTGEGLNFYYRDFYDGRGAAQADEMSSYGAPANHARAQLVQRHAGPDGPRSWLDVGTGWGYFAKHAAEILPHTVFDGLDQGSGVDRALERGWLAHAYRENAFPELADELRGRYDVISMHHYLEHTLDPRAELAAAARALEPGGLLEIEMPDAECVLRHVFRSWWVPYFQPQHLNFPPVGNLLQALVEHGFRPLEVQQAEAHQPVEVLMALVFAMTKIGPDPDHPWRATEASDLQRKVNQVAWTKVFPKLINPALKVDILVNKALISRLSHGNAYRIVAVREGGK
ncbi:class I SAM-dependent methyltransferase [Sporichthya brevicatena]|uniref:Class I SAM-dependent methyltransferase n=1 Tax=Sporichthya brevicatena TaxID=171442 RepID=A0ABP3RM10_9ACTN